MTVDQLLDIQPVIPVITIERAEDARPLAEALVAGGLRVLEITLRTDVAPVAIRLMAEIPGAIAGAGTALTPEDVTLAADAGAQFIVSPGLTPQVVEAARARSIPLLPGVATASELMTGIALGLDRFKFFPAEQAGGVPMLKALAAPFRRIRFCPTGGITATTAGGYLDLPNVACVGGAWVCPPALVNAGDWSAITRLARAASALRRAPA